MKKLILLLCCLPFFATAQNDSIQQVIDAEVWTVFKQAYAELDAEKMIAIHTADVLRASPWGIKPGEVYFESLRSGYARHRSKGTARSIDFNFEYRIAYDTQAYEVGYYKVVRQSEEEDRTFYGQFHVVLKKVDGTWKIAQDWDSDQVNGKKITAEDYEAAKLVVKE